MAHCCSYACLCALLFLATGGLGASEQVQEDGAMLLQVTKDHIKAAPNATRSLFFEMLDCPDWCSGCFDRTGHKAWALDEHKHWIWKPPLTEDDKRCVKTICCEFEECNWFAPPMIPVPTACGCAGGSYHCVECKPGYKLVNLSEQHYTPCVPTDELHG